MRVFLDANILFSGSLEGSRMQALLRILFVRSRCLTNAYAVEEARRNLELKAPEGLTRLEELVGGCDIVSSSPLELQVSLKSKDLPILSGAVSGGATHLLTGDERDFGPFFGKTFRGVLVVSPKMLAEELVRLGWI